MKTARLFFAALATALVAADAQAHVVRAYPHGHVRLGSARSSILTSAYVDPHHPGAQPQWDRTGRRVDSHGHPVDRQGRHLDRR